MSFGEDVSSKHISGKHPRFKNKLPINVRSKKSTSPPKGEQEGQGHNNDYQMATPKSTIMGDQMSQEAHEKMKQY